VPSASTVLLGPFVSTAISTTALSQGWNGAAGSRKRSRIPRALVRRCRSAPDGFRRGQAPHGHTARRRPKLRLPRPDPTHHQVSCVLADNGLMDLCGATTRLESGAR
jgi:hypothetical protein